MNLRSPLKIKMLTIKLNLINTRFSGNKARSDLKIASFPKTILITDEIISNKLFLEIKENYYKKNITFNIIENKTLNL